MTEPIRRRKVLGVLGAALAAAVLPKAPEAVAATYYKGKPPKGGTGFGSTPFGSNPFGA